MASEWDCSIVAGLALGGCEWSRLKIKPNCLVVSVTVIMVSPLSLVKSSCVQVLPKILNLSAEITLKCHTQVSLLPHIWRIRIETSLIRARSTEQPGRFGTSKQDVEEDRDIHTRQVLLYDSSHSRASRHGTRLQCSDPSPVADSSSPDEDGLLHCCNVAH